MDFKIGKKRLAHDDSDDESDEVSEKKIITSGNEIYFYADISKKEILELIKQIRELTFTLQIKSIQYDFDPHINLHIYSDGGDAFMGFSIYEFIKKNKVPIYTYIDGYIASAATFMYLAGEKRFMNRNASVLIHQISTSFWGKFEELKDECENTTNLMNNLITLYTENTQIKEKKLRKLLKRELFLTFDDCKKIGFYTDEH